MEKIIDGWLLEDRDRPRRQRLTATGPGSAEVNWGTAWVEMVGERSRVKLFVMCSRYSGKAFVRVYP